MGTQQQVDRDAINKAMAQREIKHILPAEIVKATYEQGEAIAKKAQQIAIEQYQNNGEKAERFMSSPNMPEIDSLAEVYQAKIKWVTSSMNAEELQLSELEQQLWEAYLYNVENELEVNDNVQKIGDTHFLYTKPYLLDPKTRKKLPGGETALSKKQLLGMWSITLSKKDVIKGME